MCLVETFYEYDPSSYRQVKLYLSLIIYKIRW